MSKMDIALLVLVAFVLVLSVLQQIHIARLRGALLNIVEALAREPSLKLNDTLRGGLKVGKKGLKL